MRYSHTKHFWTWFQKHSDLLLAFPKMNDKEKEYWLREINTHLRAYTKKLFFEMFFEKNGLSRFIITSYGKVKYFRMAEAIAAKAPKMPGWEIIGLQPPGLISQLIIPVYGRAGIDLNDLWFLAPQERDANGKIVLKIYAELYKPVTSEMEIAVEAMLYEILGEKTIGLEIDYFVVSSMYELSVEERNALIGLDELPHWITCRDASDVYINENGIMEKRR